MAQTQTVEGTGAELQGFLEQFPAERFRLVPLALPETEQTSHEDAEAEGSLYDLLADYIGSVERNGENNSEDTGEKFTEYLVAKHKFVTQSVSL